MEIYYQSATNQIINLKSPNYRLQTANVFNYEWEYESNQSTSYGGKITKFTKAISKKKLILTVSGKTKSEYYDAMNNFFAITEKDVVELTLGRLYVNGFYCECYITECQKSEWESGCPLCETEITLVTPYPFFISETKQEYAVQEITGEYGQFPMKYPTRYASWSTNQTLINPHFSNSPFKLILYGECTNPSVLINGILYKVNTVVGINEYITIDTKAKTIYLTRIDGAQVNLYNLQDREFYIFTPIPAGQNTISWDGTFQMEITIYEERSEPKWANAAPVPPVVVLPKVFGMQADMTTSTFTRLENAVGLSAGAQFNEMNAYAGRRRCILTDSGVVLRYFGEDGYTETGALTKNIYIGVMQFLVGTQVQVMVEQPKFYYKVEPLLLEAIVGGKGYHLRKADYYVSDFKFSGFKLHPTFLINGVEKDFIYHSAFEGSIYDTSANAYLLADEQVADFNADKLCSIANAKPCSGLTQLLTRPNTRKLAQNRGSGWQQMFIHTMSATQLLFMIEYASFNSQTSIGLGVSNKTDDGATNMANNTGQTSSLGNNSGMASGTNGLVSITYRGEENIWGNIWKFTDGANVYAYGIHDLYVSNYGFADNIGTTPYKNSGITLAKTNGYVSAFGYNEEFDWLFMPSETLGNSTIPVGDNFFQNNTVSTWFIARFGGGWDLSAAVGGFCWHVAFASSDCRRYLGGRLAYIPQ